MKLNPASIIYNEDSIFLPFVYGEGGHLLKGAGNYAEQVFTFQPVGGQFRAWFVPRLVGLVERGLALPTRVALTEDDYHHIVQNNGIEHDHLARLTGAQLNKPGIMIQYPDATSVVADGNHRMAKLFQVGVRRMRFYQLTVDQAREAELRVPLGWQVACLTPGQTGPLNVAQLSE